MRKEMKPGVWLIVLPTTQFKTTRINVQFLAPLQRATVTKRTLLTSLLETNSAVYPTQAALSAHLESLYGANFSIGVAREGKLHRIGVTMSTVDDRFTDTPLLPQAAAFLRTILFEPNMQAGSFDEATFAREKENLDHYLASLDDDRQTQAALGVQQLYFGADQDQAIPSFGTREDLASLTASSLAAYYQEMMQHDQVIITVLGDVDPKQVAALFADWPLDARSQTVPAVAFDLPTHPDVLTQTTKVKAQQAKFDLAYHVETDLMGPKYAATLVAEELFGGSSLSLLFTNVREKASLAYYASSMFDAFRGLMLVQTGIEGKDRQQVADLIRDQLAAVVNGDFSDALLKAVKDGILDHQRAAYDSPRFLTNQALYQLLVPDAPQNFDEFAQRIKAVDRQAVQQAAADMKLQATYFLTGEDSE
ncbi:MAG: insulinase family protein [Lacticaseibacillus paracasei]|nr:insulinase family protein [Lacticaseibacillus paracasei]